MSRNRSEIYDDSGLKTIGAELIKNPCVLMLPHMDEIFERILRTIQIQCDPFSHKETRADYGRIEGFSMFGFRTRLDNDGNEIPCTPVTKPIVFEGFLHGISAVDFIELEEFPELSNDRQWSDGIYLEVTHSPRLVEMGILSEEPEELLYVPIPETRLFLPSNSN